jgi:hypothetical protein
VLNSSAKNTSRRSMTNPVNLPRSPSLPTLLPSYSERFHGKSLRELQVFQNSPSLNRVLEPLNERQITQRHPVSQNAEVVDSDEEENANVPADQDDEVRVVPQIFLRRPEDENGPMHVTLLLPLADPMRRPPLVAYRVKCDCDSKTILIFSALLAITAVGAKLFWQ